MTSGERPRWEVPAPAGGWAPPWPQVAELSRTISSEQWTLVGGLMVQVHAARAGLPLTRPTVDVDMVLHIETGAITFAGVRDRLEALGYCLCLPTGAGPVHRFMRGDEQVDVMVADHLAPRHRPKVAGREVFAVPAGTSALRKTVDCIVEYDDGSIRLSVPDVLGALVLKGAAYKEDARDRARHLDDAVVLACAMNDPLGDSLRMEGSDRGRVRILAEALAAESHPSWLQVPEQFRNQGYHALRRVVEEPKPVPPKRRLGR